MELTASPERAKFTATRDVRVVSDNGASCSNFEAGETKSIPREMFTAAIAAGLMPEDSLAPEVTAPPAPAKKQSKEEIVSEGLIEACKTLITRGEAKDFLISGQPRAAAVKKLVDFSFTTKEVERAFLEAMHEVEHYGDDSTEHPEQGSGTTE